MNDFCALAAGHRACQGCGELLGARLTLGTAGHQVIVANATGCMEVVSTAYPYSAWNVPWVHSLFENVAAVASGIEAGLKALGRTDVKVVAQGGDGATADIGLQALSGMFERGHEVLYLCYDNEAYMNTGVQRSGLTPLYASTTTSPASSMAVGNPRPKKDMIAIALAHHVPYVATASVGYYKDMEKRIRAALQISGPKYVQIHVPCPPGWGYDSGRTIDMAQLAVQTGLYPLVEYVDGELKSVRKLNKRVPVEEYLRPQTRFRHLFQRPDGQEVIAAIQAVADTNVARYGLA